MLPADEESAFRAWLDLFNGIGLTICMVLPFVMLPLFVVFPLPYGKFTTRKCGTVINGKAAWYVLQVVAPISFSWTMFLGFKGPYLPVPMFSGRQLWLSFLWNVHFVNRTLIYANRAPSIQDMPVVVVVAWACLNAVTGYVNGYSLAVKDGGQSALMVASGSLLFIAGFAGNVWSDNRLMALRPRNPDASEKMWYCLPRGGLFNYITCPNYLCEIVEWMGFALASGFRLAPCLMLVITVATLVPRAIATKNWYRQHFGTEKLISSRKALIPYVL